jgi:hypothetical protein
MFSATNSVGQVIASVHNGATTNRYFVERALNGGSLQIVRTNAGAVASATLGPVASGVYFELGMSIDGAGRCAVSLDGAAPVALTGGPTGGLTTFQHTNVASAGAPMWGETHTLTALRRPLPDAELQAVVAAGVQFAGGV